MQPRYGQGQGQVEIVVQGGEIGGEHQLQPRRGLGEALIGAGEGGSVLFVEVQRQSRLVHLHPVGAGRRQPLQDLAIDRQKTVQQVAGVRAVPGLGQLQPGHRADQHRPGVAALGAGLEEFVHRLGGGEREGLAGDQFGGQVVIVGVEPLGHLAGRGVLATTAGLLLARPGPASHGEIEFQPLGAGEARRDGADHQGGVQHLVVEREVVAGQDVDPQLGLAGPALLAEVGGGLQETSLIEAAGPEAFEGCLELAAGADAGKAQIGDQDGLSGGHGISFAGAARAGGI